MEKSTTRRITSAIPQVEYGASGCAYGPMKDLVLPFEDASPDPWQLPRYPAGDLADFPLNQAGDPQTYPGHLFDGRQLFESDVEEMVQSGQTLVDWGIFFDDLGQPISGILWLLSVDLAFGDEAKGGTGTIQFAVISDQPAVPSAEDAYGDYTLVHLICGSRTVHWWFTHDSNQLVPPSFSILVPEDQAEGDPPEVEAGPADVYVENYIDVLRDYRLDILTKDGPGSIMKQSGFKEGRLVWGALEVAEIGGEFFFATPLGEPAVYIEETRLPSGYLEGDNWNLNPNSYFALSYGMFFLSFDGVQHGADRHLPEYKNDLCASAYRSFGSTDNENSQRLGFPYPIAFGVLAHELSSPIHLGEALVAFYDAIQDFDSRLAAQACSTGFATEVGLP